MENQHRKISGYSELTQVEIDLMNEIKATGSRLEELMSTISVHLDVQWEAATEEEQTRMDAACPQRWVVLAAEHLQQGIMCATRAVAQPTTF